MLLKKYRYIDRIKFVRIVLNWSAGDLFCLDIASCWLSNKDGNCKNIRIHQICADVGMDNKQINKYSYIPANAKET